MIDTQTKNTLGSDKNGSSRREFVKLSLTASGALLVGTTAGCKAHTTALADASSSKDVFQSLYLQVRADNTFLLTFDKAEMGQGVITGQATMFGEEADIHPSTFQMIPATADPRFATSMGHMITGGSTSTPDRFDVLRKIAAAYRYRLKAAAAQSWGISIDQVSTNNGMITNLKTQKTEPYAAFNAAIADLKNIPEDIPLKAPSEWKYIGKFNESIDAKEKSTGVPEFGIDFEIPGMRTAIVLRPPAFGGKLKSFDKDAIQAIEGVEAVVELSRGLGVVCDKYWRCLKVRKQIKDSMLEWDNTNASMHTTSDLYETYRKEATIPGESESGKESPKIVRAEYSLPYLSHAPMEPQNGVAWRQGERFDVWTPTQGPTFVKAYVEKFTEIKSENVFVHNSKYLGGGFGRRGQMDYVIELVELALQVSFPVKLMWSREDDIKFSPMRPMTVHALQAKIAHDGSEGASGSIDVKEWKHHIAGEAPAQDIVGGMTPLLTPKWMPNAISKGIGSMAKGVLDMFSMAPMIHEGSEQPYSLPYDVKTIEQESEVPTTFWRSVGSSHNGFVVESFIDEVAHAMGQDPLAWRLELLKGHSRAQAVIKKAGEVSGWDSYEKTATRGLGFAYHFSFNTHVAEIADVEIIDNKIKVHKVYAVVDCGVAVNPDIVKKQIQSGIIYGMTAALYGKIEFDRGLVVQSNFDDYPLLRGTEAPDIDVTIIPSQESPTGIGEPGTPPIAGAIANGVFSATGKRMRDLPFKYS